MRQKFINPLQTQSFFKFHIQLRFMKFSKIRSEKAVDSFIESLKEGNHKKANIRLGELRGTPKEFMELYSYLTKDSSLKDVEIKISTIKAKIDCLSCDWKGDAQIKENHVECPRCRSDVNVLSGHELHFDF